LGPVVHRWHQHPGNAGRLRGGKKGDPDEPPDHALGRSRGGFGTKINLVCDGGAVPLGIHVVAGQSNESLHVEPVLNAVRIGREHLRPSRLAGDKGYSYRRVRDWLRARRITPVIPTRDDPRDPNQRRDPNFDKETYRRRNVIERCIGWLKECRRIVTRFEKLALNFAAMIKLAMIGRCFRLLFSDSA
jgi:transposase